MALSFRLVSQLDAEVLWALIYRASQSNAEIVLSGSLNITAHIVNIPRGQGGAKNFSRVYTSAQDFVTRNKGIIQIKNQDAKCLAHAVVIGLALITPNENYKNLMGDQIRMEQKVQDLLNETDLTLETGGSIFELNVIQDVLPPHTQLVVFDCYRTKNIFFKRNMINVENYIYLFLHDEHYDVIKSITAFCVANYFCNLCYKSYNNKAAHRCKIKCNQCKVYPACMLQAKIKCIKCNITFKSRQCYTNHQKNKVNRNQTVCDYYRCCDKCEKTYVMYRNRKSPHICGELFCTNCKTHKPRDHLCYIKKDSKTEPDNTEKVMRCFFDLECTIDTPISIDEEGTIHQCNLLVSHTVCDLCENVEFPDGQSCEKCQERRHVFWENPIKQFIDYLAADRKHFKKIYIFSYNFSGYDGMFILRYFLEQMKVCPKIIMNGGKILSLDFKNLHFRDALNFFNMPLKKLPATLGLPNQMMKGTYPYLFNSLENMNYVGPIPGIEYYDVDRMSNEEREEFLLWHDEKVKNNYVFNQKEELLNYCDNDTKILRVASTKLCQIIKAIGGVNPLTETLTLAHLASKIFRRKHLEDNLLGLIPIRGYRCIDNQSRIAIKWMLFEERLTGRKIQHAYNGREVRLASGHLVDGYCEIGDEKIVYEFNGCR